jgi:peroxiredoxin
LYRGSYNEESLGSRVQFQRNYRVEVRFFVLDTPSRGTELAAMTVLHNRGSRTAGTEVTHSSVRLERVLVDHQGKASPGSHKPVVVPLDRMPTLELGAFVEIPATRSKLGQGWETAEPERPLISWRIAGNEVVNGLPCLKLLGVQQSDDWERPRADRSAWRRQETVWVAPRTGLVQRVERIIEHHEPARKEVSQRSVMRYELENGLQYPAQLAQDRRQETLQAISFREAANPLLEEPAKNLRQLQDLQRRISAHLENQPPTPYREAIQQLRRQVESAARGEVIPVVHEEMPTRAVTVAMPGEPAPDFVAGPIITKESGRLSKWKGKPTLLLFYHPASLTAQDVLQFAQQLETSHGKFMHVVGLSVSDDRAAVQQQREQLRLTFPVYNGGGLRISYGVETTPKLVLIDANGIIRGMYLGWGRETPNEVITEIRRWWSAR